MADTIIKTKMQLRSPNFNANGGEKTPPTPSKLMINHGKPNFTIQRSPQAQGNGEDNPMEFQVNKNNNYCAYKTAGSLNYATKQNGTTITTTNNTNNNNNDNVVVSTKFNGAFRPTNISIDQKQPHQQQTSTSSADNEASKVILRRAKAPAATLKEDEDDSVPEFIRRQRRIQERLAKENVLDFESRRSGYFTQVLISPSSPNRKSFVETMSSPAVVPALEIPAPASATAAALSSPVPRSIEEVEEEGPKIHGESHESLNGNTNGHADHNTNGFVEEEEVAKAIEEVNKAVAGEDDEKLEEVIEQQQQQQEEEQVQIVAATVTSIVEVEPQIPCTPIPTPTEIEPSKQVDIATATAAVTSLQLKENEHEIETPKTNGHIEVVEVHARQENGTGEDGVTICHTNGFDEPRLPSPDPSGALGVNYEPKTVVSFSKDLSSEINKYPDTVQINGNHEVKSPSVVEENIKAMQYLKFDIKGDEEDVQVTPVLRAE